MHWHRTLHAQGWIAPNWPKEYGGPGWTVTQKYVYDEEASLAGAPRVIAFGITMCGPVLMRFGTDAQKQHFLPKILSGDIIFCQGYSEPGSGDRKSVVSGKSVSGRVDLGGRRIIKKKSK